MCFICLASVLVSLCCVGFDLFNSGGSDHSCALLCFTLGATVGWFVWCIVVYWFWICV